MATPTDDKGSGMFLSLEFALAEENKQRQPLNCPVLPAECKWLAADKALSVEIKSLGCYQNPEAPEKSKRHVGSNPAGEARDL